MAKIHHEKLNILKTKRAFKMKLKAFFIIFKGLSMKQIIFFFRRLESDFNNSETVKSVTLAFFSIQ